MNISYRIVNDGGEYMPSRPWHVESNIGNGWTRCAVCHSEADAQAHISLLRDGSPEEDAMMLGHFNA